jgi:hypothetical protein
MFNFPTCPQCRNATVWKFVLPEQADYCCNKCGHMWRVDLPIHNGQYGKFIGNWHGQEMSLLEENLYISHPEPNWNFFKGRKVWTAWQDSEAHKIVSCPTMDELTYWVACASAHGGDWYERYKELAGRSKAA